MTIEKKDGTVLEGFKYNDEGKEVCEKCGGDGFKLLMHVDGEDFFGYTFKCVGCGSIVAITSKRREVWG